jgi:hypothetical protein
MLTKLTLTIDQTVIEHAKEYAQQKNRSVSRIVEDYLKNISTNPEAVSFQKNLYSPITDSGMFQDSGKPYKDMLDEALQERFQ